ncbi:hypothetical protein DFJ73DRAFT_859399 [Zopfochytrium polystomum]|nr:hypothetical protein DFJ73DRAFT_859399 [Zopfochytrium polystomum]
MCVCWFQRPSLSSLTCLSVCRSVSPSLPHTLSLLPLVEEASLLLSCETCTCGNARDKETVARCLGVCGGPGQKKSSLSGRVDRRRAMCRTQNDGRHGGQDPDFQPNGLLPTRPGPFIRPHIPAIIPPEPLPTAPLGTNGLLSFTAAIGAADLVVRTSEIACAKTRPHARCLLRLRN